MTFAPDHVKHFSFPQNESWREGQIARGDTEPARFFDSAMARREHGADAGTVVCVLKIIDQRLLRNGRGQKLRERVRSVQKTLHSWWIKKLPFPVEE